MANEEAVRDENRVPALLATNASATTETLAIYGDSSTHALKVFIAGSEVGGDDINIAQVNGATVNVGTGAAGTGTLRVTTSTDSTIGTVTTVSTVSSVSAVIAGTGATNIGKAEDAVPGSGDTGIYMLAIRKATPVNTSDTDGDYEGLQVNGGLLWTNLGALVSGEDQTNNLLQVAEKPLAVSTYAPSNDVSAAAEASSVSKAAAGTLYGFTFSNGNAAVRYLQFFNSTTVPADTTVPTLVFSCPATSTISGEWPKGRHMATGIAWANSSTQNTKTIGATDSLADINYA